MRFNPPPAERGRGGAHYDLTTERDLSQFDRDAKVARSRHRWFKAKNIRNNMMLYKTKQHIKVDKLTKKLSLILGQFEAKWNNVQKEKLKKRIEMKLRKTVQAKDYVKKLLQECKTWGGPCTTADELCYILTQKPDQEKVIVRTEMAFFCT